VCEAGAGACGAGWPLTLRLTRFQPGVGEGGNRGKSRERRPVRSLMLVAQRASRPHEAPHGRQGTPGGERHECPT
jgi:hypothetical protein